LNNVLTLSAPERTGRGESPHLVLIMKTNNVLRVLNSKEKEQ
jgi:hypothetical protein